MALNTSMKFSVLAGVILALALLVSPTTGYAKDMRVIDRSDGGFDVEFPNGCSVRYDRYGNRGDSSGRCKKKQYESADEGVRAELGSNDSGGGTWYNRLVGASSDGAESQLDINGFRQVDSFDSGRDGYGTVWFNDSTRQCLQVINVNRRVDSAVDINTHPNCRPRGNHGNSGNNEWYSRLVGASSDGAASQLNINGFRQVDSFDSGRDGYGTVWFNDSTRQCLQVINVNRRVDSAVDIKTHPSCRQQGSHGNSGSNEWYSRLVGASSEGAKSQLDINGFRQVDSFDSGRNDYGLIWFNNSSRQCLQVIIVDGRVDSAVDIKTHPRCRR